MRHGLCQQPLPQGQGYVIGEQCISAVNGLPQGLAPPVPRSEGPLLTPQGVCKLFLSHTHLLRLVAVERDLLQLGHSSPFLERQSIA